MKRYAVSQTDGRKRIDKLSDYERSMMSSWAEKWIDIGLRTGNPSRPSLGAAGATFVR
mgnify:CR=1 FL=1